MRYYRHFKVRGFNEWRKEGYRPDDIRISAVVLAVTVFHDAEETSMTIALGLLGLNTEIDIGKMIDYKRGE